MNNHGHSDFSGLMFLILVVVISAALFEGGLIAAFILVGLIWHKLGWGLIFAFALVLWPLLCLWMRKGW
jgi:energy-coupling factor transporter transmembrane protein EcfT